MGKVKTLEKSQVLVDVVLEGLQKIKGEHIVCIDLKKIENSVCDYFIICTGTSNTHVNSLAGAVEKEVKKNLNDKPWHSEGYMNAEWILLDYVSVVVHVFQKEAREFYNLEGLWADAKIIQVKQA